jgi:4'-phosphopantetheinyl transferase
LRFALSSCEVSPGYKPFKVAQLAHQQASAGVFDPHLLNDNARIGASAYFMKQPIDAWQIADIGTVASTLGDNEVHLWLLSLDAPSPPFDAVVAALEQEERERASRFHFAHDRRRYATGRGLLRHLLGGYTCIAPEEVRFSYGPEGKPFLRSGSTSRQLQFSLSHSGGWALVGLTWEIAIGVDLEAVREVPEQMDIARANFASSEYDCLSRLPAAQRAEGFFACWTRKEAVVKALGGGLSLALNRFEVSLDPCAPAELRSIVGSRTAAECWTLWGFRPLASFWAAVALRGTNRNLRLLRLC